MLITKQHLAISKKKRPTIPSIRCEKCRREECQCVSTQLKNDIPTINLKKLQTQIYNLGTRRKFFQNYFEGANPVFLFNSSAFSLEVYDYPVTKPLLMQYNAILASSSRAFGSPKVVYGIFEKNAILLANELVNDSTYETAVAFNLLSFHFWGSDEEKTSKYKHIALDLCRKASQLYPNHFHDLSLLQITTLSIQGSSDKIEKEVLPTTDSTSPIPNFEEIRSWVDLRLAITDNVFNADPTSSNPFNIIDETTHQMLQDKLDLVDATWDIILPAGSPKLYLTKAVTHLLKGIFNYCAGKITTSLQCIERGYDSFARYEEFVMMSGPFFFKLIHSAFFIANAEKETKLSQKLLQCLEYYREISAAKKFLEMCKQMNEQPHLNRLGSPCQCTQFQSSPEIVSSPSSSEHEDSTPSQYHHHDESPTYFIGTPESSYESHMEKLNETAKEYFLREIGNLPLDF